jgi:outer membrane protein TolC
MLIKKPLLFLITGYFLSLLTTEAQVSRDTLSGGLTLEECINFALQHKPSVQQAFIDEQIGERDIKASLSDWYPQITAQYNLQHYLKLPVIFLPDFSDLASGRRIPVTTGVVNSSNVLFQASQTLFSNDVLLASKAARYVRLQNEQNIQNTKINTVVNVSKAFYDILLTQEQLRILDEAIIRQEKQYKDAYSQYQNGIVDKTDYQRASISLSNARSERKRTEESIRYKHAFLKELMGYQPDDKLQLAFDNQQMEQDMMADTIQQVTYANRIEFQQLQTQKQLQGLSVNYYRWNYLPTVSAFINYNLVYQNNEFSELFKQSFPTSLMGLSVALPIFQGTRRIQNLRRAQLQDKRLDVEIVNTRNIINTEYEQAMANYKSDINEWITVKNNVALAEDVYKVIKLQYDEGIKTYLELIVAETDLRTTQLNYFNALYRVLASKLDLQRARGNINVN